MEQQRIKIGKNNKLEILNSKTIYNDGKLEVVIEGDYLINATDVACLLAKDEQYLIANFSAPDYIPSIHMLVDKVIYEDTVKLLKERERDRENMLKAILERDALKEQNKLLKEELERLKRKNKSWF